MRERRREQVENGGLERGAQWGVFRVVPRSVRGGMLMTARPRRQRRFAVLKKGPRWRDDVEGVRMKDEVKSND